MNAHSRSKMLDVDAAHRCHHSLQLLHIDCSKLVTVWNAVYTMSYDYPWIQIIFCQWVIHEKFWVLKWNILIKLIFGLLLHFLIYYYFYYWYLKYLYNILLIVSKIISKFYFSIVNHRRQLKRNVMHLSKITISIRIK